MAETKLSQSHKPTYFCSNSKSCFSEETNKISVMKVSDSRRFKRNVDRTLPSKTEVWDELLGVTPFNTTMNFIVPGAKVHLAHNTEEGSLDHLAMQAFFGLFWAIAWITTIAVPTIVTISNFQPFGIGRAFADYDYNSPDSFHLKWKMDQRLADAIGLDWDSCVQKTICQAREHPDKYGVLGSAIQLLSPVFGVNYWRSHGMLDSTVNRDSGQDCRHTYRCFFDVLDVLIYLRNYCFAYFDTST